MSGILIINKKTRVCSIFYEQFVKCSFSVYLHLHLHARVKGMATRKFCLLTYQICLIYETRSLAINFSFEICLVDRNSTNTGSDDMCVGMLHVLQPRVHELSMPSSWMRDL